MAGDPNENRELPGGTPDEIEFVLEDVQDGRAREDDRREAPSDRRDSGGRNLEQENSNLKRALAESRARGRRLRDQMVEDRARRDEDSRRAAAARHGQPSAEEVQRLKEADDLADAAPTLLAMVERQTQGAFLGVRKSIAAISQNNARARYTDYDRVLEESGVRDRLTLGPDGRPRDPELYQRILLEADDPGEDVYALAHALLEERDDRGGRGSYDTERELPPATGSRAEGRRDVFREMERTHARPRGIGEAPAAAPGTRVRLTARDIDMMTDAQYEALPKEIRDAYLDRPRSR